MTLVPRVQTFMTRSEIRSALAMGHRKVFGVDASDGRLMLASCQAWLETGNGKFCWNHNFGNVDALVDWTGDVFELEAREVIRGRDVMMTKRLCAFASAAEGAAHQWRRLRDNYPKSLASFDSGDPTLAARTLKSERYYTASVEGYTHQMVALSREYARAFPRGSA